MSLEVDSVSYSYPGAGKSVLRDVNLKVRRGEIHSLLGSSGSGKTTLLYIIAGFLKPDKGRIRLSGRDITGERIHRRNLGIVFQDYALFPHMSVRANVEFGLRSRGIPRGEVRERAARMMELVGMSGYGDRRPDELSGGERQRVALARTLAYEPELLLLDEPLSALDASLREGLRRELRSILKDLGTTALYVTHDQMEALALSDRIAFLSGGHILEEGTPAELYWGPRMVETARFFGIANIMKVLRKGDGSVAIKGLGKISIDSSLVPEYIGFRPESCNVKGEGVLSLSGIVKGVEYRGRESLVRIRSGSVEIVALVPASEKVKKGSPLVISVVSDALIPLGSSGKRRKRGGRNR